MTATPNPKPWWHFTTGETITCAAVLIVIFAINGGPETWIEWAILGPAILAGSLTAHIAKKLYRMLTG